MSSRSLSDLHPLLRPIAVSFLQRCEQAGIDILVTCTYRSRIEQDELYKLGRIVRSHVGPWDVRHPLGRTVTRAKGGESEHNHSDHGVPSALAFDVVPVLNGKPVWDERSPLWARIGDIGLALGLNWYGVPGAPYREYPHFALRESKLMMET